MKKMSFLERMGLVERVEDNPSPYNDHYEECPDIMTDEQETINVSTVQNATETLVSDIYANNNLSDMSRSIFKVEEINKSLPATMSTDTKREAVTGILASFDLAITDILSDASARSDAIKTTSEAMMAEYCETIKSLRDKIEDMREQIEACEAEIAANQDKYAFVCEVSNEEIERIDALVDFLVGF